MRVTKRFCTNCNGEGDLIDVVLYNGNKEAGVPASEAKRTPRSYDEESDDYDVTETSAPYPCGKCGGAGFYFYIDDEDRFGETLKLSELPKDAKLGEVSGPEEWLRYHDGKPANFVWKSWR